MGVRERRGVFVSYARADGEAFARDLVARLGGVAGHDLDVWMDRGEMRGGRDWRQQIKDGIDRCGFLVLVMTPGAVASGVVEWEWRCAREQGVCVFPVRASPDLDFDALPAWIAAKHHYDVEEEWETLVNYLTSPCQADRVPFMAPPLDRFVARPAEFAAVRERLLADGGSGSVAITTSLQGAGGYGKTTLAAAICHDDDVLAAFDDGVLWATIGQDTGDRHERVQRELNKLYAALTGEEANTQDVEEAARRVVERLRNKRALLVIDDVWNTRDLRWFLQGGEACARLVTTRRFDVALEAAGRDGRVPVDEMRVDEAVAMLTAGLDIDDVEAVDPARLRALVARLGEWPLLIRLARGVIAEELALGNDLDGTLSYLAAELDETGLPALDEYGAAGFDPRDPDARQAAAAVSVQVSLDQLADEDAHRWAQLAVFPEDTAIPLATAGQLWEVTEHAAAGLAKRLNRLALVNLDRGTGSFTVHDVLLAVAGIRVVDIAEHGRLVDAWGDPHTLPDDGYAWQWIGHHLQHAGRPDELRGLLADGAWVIRKLRHSSVTSLLGDYDRIPDDADLRLIAGAIRLSGHVLNEDPDQLASQLHGRLSPDTGPTIAHVLDTTAAATERPWLRPDRPTLDPPGGPLLRTLIGHTDPVVAVAVTGDGRHAVTGSQDRTVKVWDLASGQELRTLTGHTGRVASVAVTGDGRHVITGSWDRTAKVWDLASGEQLRTLTGHTSGVVAVAVTADGRHAVTGSMLGTAKVWDLASGEQLGTLPDHTSGVMAVAVTGDGRRVVTGSWDGTAKVWDLASGEQLRTLTGHSGPVEAVAVTADGRHAVTGSREDTAKVWDLASGEQLRTLTGHTGQVTSLAVTADGRHAVTGSHDRTVKVWDLATGEQPRTLTGHTGQVTSLAVTADGRHAVTGSRDGTAKVWDPATGQQLRTLTGHTDGVLAVAVTAHGRHVVTGSWDDTAKVWDLSSGEQLRTLTGHSGPVEAVAVTADGRHVVTGSRDGTAKVWDLASGDQLRTLTGHTDGVLAVAVTADGRHAITGSYDTSDAIVGPPDGVAAVWDLATGKQLRVLTGHSGPVEAVAVTADGRYTITGSYDGVAAVWDLATGEQLRILTGHSGPVEAVAVTADGRHAITGSHDRTLRLWAIDDDCDESVTTFVADAAFHCCAVSEARILAADAARRLHVLQLVARQGGSVL